jgi:hypothetical protein
MVGSVLYKHLHTPIAKILRHFPRTFEAVSEFKKQSFEIEDSRGFFPLLGVLFPLTGACYSTVYVEVLCSLMFSSFR